MLPFLDRLGSSAGSARLLRRGRFLAAGLCLLLAGLTALGSARPRAAGRGPAGVPVVVASRDLPAGRVLTRADLAVRSWPRLLPSGDAVARLPDALGERLASPLRRGEPLTVTRLTSDALTTGLPPSSVAVPVPLAGATAGLVHAGAAVELIALTPPDGGLATPIPPTAHSPDVVARHVTVLATLPATSDGSGGRVLVATSRELAVQLAGLSASHEFAVVVDSF